MSQSAAERHLSDRITGNVREDVGIENAIILGSKETRFVVEHDIRQDPQEKERQVHRVIGYREDKLNDELMIEQPINRKNSVTELEKREIPKRSLVGKEEDYGNMSLSQIDSNVLDVLTSLLSDKNFLSICNTKEYNQQ